MITPLVHQQRFSDTAPDKCGVWHACGTGKTYTALIATSKRLQSCLIICPKGVKSNWQERCKEFPNHLWKVVTKEEFRRDWKILPTFQGVVIDEAHHFSSIRSQLHKALRAYLKKVKPQIIWPMTATPYRREPLNIFALGRIIGYDWNYMDFLYKFYYQQHFGHRIVWLPKKNIEQEVAELVAKIGDIVPFEACADLPPVQYKIEKLDLNSAQKEAFKDLEMTEANPLVYYGKEHQICGGIYNDEVFEQNAKFERITELADTTSKLAVLCRYTRQIDALKTILEELGHTVYVINGQTKDKTEESRKAEASSKCVLLIQMDTAEGWEAPSFNVIVFVSLSYSYLSMVQSQGRFIRVNKQNSPKLFMYLIISNTIDEAVYKNVMDKRDFDIAIYAREKPLRSVSKMA